MLFSDEGSLYSTEKEENNNEGGSESFDVNMSTKCGISSSTLSMKYKIHLWVVVF